MKKGIGKIEVYTAECRYCGYKNTTFSGAKTYETEKEAMEWQEQHETTCDHNPQCDPCCRNCAHVTYPLGKHNVDCEKKKVKNMGWSSYCEDYVYRPIKKEKPEKKKSTRNGK